MVIRFAGKPFKVSIPPVIADRKFSCFDVGHDDRPPGSGQGEAVVTVRTGEADPASRGDGAGDNDSPVSVRFGDGRMMP
jgi:hypothetical protein